MPFSSLRRSSTDQNILAVSPSCRSRRRGFPRVNVTQLEMAVGEVEAIEGSGTRNGGIRHTTQSCLPDFIFFRLFGAIKDFQQ